MLSKNKLSFLLWLLLCDYPFPEVPCSEYIDSQNIGDSIQIKHVKQYCSLAEPSN